MLSYNITYKLTYYKFYVVSNPNSRLEKNTMDFQVHVKKNVSITWKYVNLCCLDSDIYINMYVIIYVIIWVNI